MSSRHNISLVTKINDILKVTDATEGTIDLLYYAIDEYVAQIPITENDDELDMPPLVGHTTPIDEETEVGSEHICETCSMECYSAIELLDHNMIYHENAFGDQFGCDVCQYWAKTSDELNDHYRMTHGETDSESTVEENEHNPVANEKDNSADEKDNSEDEQESKSHVDDESYDSEDSDGETETMPKNVDEQISEFKKKLPKLSIDMMPDCEDEKSIEPLKETREKFKQFKDIIKKRTRTKTRIIPMSEHTPRNVHHTQNGKFVCPVCELKFNTPYHLGEHFSYAHQSYEMQKVLDTKTSIYFPGFTMLHMINMIDFLDNCQLKKIKDESCPICYVEYTTSIIKRARSCTQFDRLHKSLDKSSYQKIEDAIKKTYADTETSLFDHHYPLIMTCCKKYICHLCLKSHIMATYDIACPFCTKDHTREDMTYVTELKPGMFNKLTWHAWWTKHLDILF
jgi:rubrerythrin